MSGNVRAIWQHKWTPFSRSIGNISVHHSARHFKQVISGNVRELTTPLFIIKQTVPIGDVSTCLNTGTTSVHYWVDGSNMWCQDMSEHLQLHCIPLSRQLFNFSSRWCQDMSDHLQHKCTYWAENSNWWCQDLPGTIVHHWIARPCSTIQEPDVTGSIPGPATHFFVMLEYCYHHLRHHWQF